MREIRERTVVTDKEFDLCMQCMRSGDKSALREVYEAYLPYIYSIVLGVVGRKEAAEDVTGDFFIKLWEIADTYKPGNGHRAWLARIAKNLAIDSVRKSKREILSEVMDEVNAVSDDASDGGIYKNSEGNPSKGIDTKSIVESEVIEDISITEALQKLSDNEREIVHLKVMGELSFKEIARLLGQPMGTVTWRYRNAMNKLRRCGYE